METAREAEKQCLDSNIPRYSGESYYSLKIRREISVDAFLLGDCAFQRARIRKDTPSAKTLGKQRAEGPRSFIAFPVSCALN